MNVLLRNIRLPRCRTQGITPKRNGSSCDTQSSGVRTLVIECLEQRAFIRAKGEEVVSFLQGLTTNDMAKLESPTNAAVYTMFLNKAGRVLYDAIMYRTSEPSTILIECDKDVSNDLKRHLKLYRVRRKIEIDDVGDDEFKVWSMFDPSGKHIDMAKLAIMKDVKTMPDPRLRDLGCRLLASSDKTHSDLSKLCTDMQVMVELSSECCNYRDHRYGLGVAEGVQDLQPGKQFPLEANCDLLNGVSFNKGCYIGQELTARVHHTGVIRKRHMPIALNNPLPANSTKDVRTQDGAKVGTVLGVTTDKALGLLRVEQVLKASELFIDGKPCHTKKPIWWPAEALSNISRREGM